MGCPAEVVIGENLAFSVCTHDPIVSDLTDADSAPSYRVYEDETGTPILTGSMAKLDDDNTTGLYTETITCSIANGFENGKTYTIYVEATVNTNTGGISFTFKAYTSRTTSGAGSESYTIAVHDGLSNPVVGAEVWVTTDQAGLTVVAGTLLTDDLGEVTFLLDSGVTYYAWRDHASYNFTNPEQFTVP